MKSDQSDNQSPEPLVTSVENQVLPSYLAYVGINEAARLTGKGKQQIYRDIEAGRLSWHIEESGRKTLQIADLDRVYKLKSQNVTSTKTGDNNRLLPASQTDVTTTETIETAVRIAVLEAELKAKAEALQRVEDENRDLRQTRDKLLDQNNRLTMLLPAPTPPAPLVVAEPEPPKRPSFWQRLFP
jgi:hypothetical protein